MKRLTPKPKLKNQLGEQDDGIIPEEFLDNTGETQVRHTIDGKRKERRGTKTSRRKNNN
jgi:hypothetical protein